MKILAITSALDLRLSFGATGAWWQLFKGLYEIGIDIVATPYAGEAVESPWWRSYPNPCLAESQLFLAAKRVVNRVLGPRPGSGSGKLAQALVRHRIRPRKPVPAKRDRFGSLSSPTPRARKRRQRADNR